MNNIRSIFIFWLQLMCVGLCGSKKETRSKSVLNSMVHTRFWSENGGFLLAFSSGEKKDQTEKKLIFSRGTAAPILKWNFASFCNVAVKGNVPNASGNSCTRLSKCKYGNFLFYQQRLQIERCFAKCCVLCFSTAHWSIWIIRFTFRLKEIWYDLILAECRV